MTSAKANIIRVAVAALLVCAAWLPAVAHTDEQPGRPADAKPQALANVGLDQKLNNQVPLDVTFRDETGRTVPLSEYFNGKPVILTLNYFRCPMLCSEVLAGLASAMIPLKFTAGHEFNVVTISIDPTDTPASAEKKKEQYLERYRRPEAYNGWHFLTGDKPAIDAVADAVGFRYSYQPEFKQYAHPSAIMVLTAEGKVAQYYFGIEYAPRDLRLGLVEASQNKIGTIVDQALLFCYHYDARTGKYTPAVMAAVRAGGVLTVIGIGVLVGILIFKDPNRAGKGRKA
jgi:protein SCO1